MDASAGSSPRHSQENPPKHGGGRGEEPAEEIGGEAADDFMFADDMFPSLPDFPCLSSSSSSTYSSSSSSNSSSAYTNAGGGPGGAGGAAGQPSEPASAGEGFDGLEDIDQILDFASLSVPWDSEPLFPDVGMMIEDAMSAPPHPVGDVPNGRVQGKALLEGTGGEEACMDAAAGDDLPRVFMEWLTSNRESISAEDLRGIRLRRSTIEAAAARLGGGRRGTMQLLKLILTWVQNHQLQKKRPHGAMEEATGSHGHGQLSTSSPGVNSGYEFPAGGQDTVAAAGTSWMPYQQSFTPPAYGGETVYPSGAGQQYTFHQQSCGASSLVVNSQPFSPPAVGDMHAASGGNISRPQQHVQFPGAAPGSYTMPRVVPQPFSSGFAGQYSMGSQCMAGVEASATKEARKKRMARQRRLSCLQQQRNHQLSLGQIQGAVLQQEPSPRAAHSAPVTPSAGGWGFWPSSGQQILNPLSKSNSSTPMLQVPSQEAAAAPPAKPASSARQEESPQRAAASDKRQSGAKADKNLRFLLQKVLKQSDVGGLGRIVLPKKEAEIHLPELKTRDGISIPMEDIGTSRVWNMRYRFWPNNKSRMYLLENTGDFVRSNELQEGDFIVIYSDVKSGKYHWQSTVYTIRMPLFECLLQQEQSLIRGVKVRPAQERGNGCGVLGKHKHGCPERTGASGSEDGGGGVDGTGKPDGACKSRSPHAAVRRARQEAAAMGQMAVSI